VLAVEPDREVVANGSVVLVLGVVLACPAGGAIGGLAGVPGETIATSAVAVSAAVFAGGSMIRMTLGSGRAAASTVPLAASLSGICCQAAAEITPVSAAAC
jgi:hypothetical protein